MQQENNDEVRPKAMASAAQSPNSDSDKPLPVPPPPPPPPPKVREEGELTSSDDDALPAHADAPSTSICAPPSSTVRNVSATTYLQGRNAGKPMSASLTARTADKHPQTPGYSKGFNKNKVLLKSSNPGWHAPAGNANLVISFSDDDESGSDEERRQKTAQATIRHPQVANSSKRPPALPHMKPDTARRTAKNEGKVATKKTALNRTFMSSMTKIHGSNVKGSGPLAERKSWTKNSNVTGRILPSQDGGFNKHMDLSSNKLQDLRQQIAMRENELKLKKVQKSKENVSEPCRDIDVMGHSKASSKKSRTVSTDRQTDTEEPDAKRLKLAQNSCCRQSSRGHQDKSFVPAPSNDNVSGHLHDVKKIGQRGLHPSSGEMEIHDAKQLPPPSHNERSRLVKDASTVPVSCSLSDWVSGSMEALAIPKQTASLTNETFADHLDKSHTDLLTKSKSSSSVPNHDMCVNNMDKVNDAHAGVSAREKLMSKSDSTLQPRFLQVSDKFESLNASPDDTSVLHSLDRPIVSGCDVDSFFEIEELHDKELEEAQEHRRRCEIEERKALKAYRRAQRALAEANARCTYLYRKRELYSAQLRSFLMEDSSVLLTSRQHKQIGDTWNSSYNVYEANLDLIPASSHQLQAECEPDNQVGYGSNAQSADGDAHNRLSRNEDGNNLGSEACSEPDASTSDVLVRGNSSIANGVLLPSNDPNLAPDDGETFPSDRRSVHDAVTWPREEYNIKESGKDMNVDSARCFAGGSSQDPLFLEAYLRSKLFSRLGVIDCSKKLGTHSDSKSTAARVAEENFAGGKTQIVKGNVMPSGSKDISAHNGEGSLKPDSGISKPSLNVEYQKPLEEHSLNGAPAIAFDSGDTIVHSKEITSALIVSSSSVFRSAMMAACQSKMNDVHIIDQQEFSPDMHINDELHPSNGEDESSLEKASWPEEVVKSVSFGRIDSYTFKGAIDPFRPLCIYELRGRCNNDECPWQHLRENSTRNVNEHDSSDDADCPPGSSTICQKQRGCLESSGVLTPPKYVVCFDCLKAEPQTHGSPLARHTGASQKNIFSSSLAVSNSLVNQLPSDEPYLHGNDHCVDSFVGGGHSLYFQSRNGAGNPLRNGLGDNDQALEIALLVLNQEVNRIDGTKKALSILSRALEADRASCQLWIVYLLLYYSTMNSVSELNKRTSSVEDDLFSHAVKHNTESYELWLLYINSRRRLHDRFAAYERALSCLCRHASAKNGHPVHASAAILDLFLQMLHCFCISGNIAKAVQRIQGLILPDGDSDESHSLLLCDILQCLTMSDKCIFWVSCVYLVIYRKLPDALVQQFEYEKDISVMEWPPVHLPLEEKQQVFKLMELAVDSLGLHGDSESSESCNHKSAHLIALNHISLVAAIDGEERCKIILEKYKNSYPSCLQLSLLSARAHADNGEDKIFEGFEEALGNWPTEVPGIQCIWNQFAEYAIKNGRPDRAKEIMDQWFHSVWKPLSYDESVDSEKDDNRISSLYSLSESNLNALLSNFTNMDLVFGLLNLSVLRLFQNDILAAHKAVDKALKAADAEVLRQCVREHAVFLFNHRSQLKKDSSLRGLIDILKSYVVHAQSVSGPVCLSTKFIDDLKKPRVRQLVSNILCPSAPDLCLLNSVLHAWFGPSLLPQHTDELKDLVDFIESILEVSPGNYQVAISACRLIWKNRDGGKSMSPSVLFWASSLLVNTIYRAIPIPPEFVWVEAADLLGKLTDKLEICESFHQRALSVYPFSMRLWKSFLRISAPDKRSNVIQAARGKGIELDYEPASCKS